MARKPPRPAGRKNRTRFPIDIGKFKRLAQFQFLSRSDCADHHENEAPSAPRGGYVTTPERRSRGERHPGTTLTEERVRYIRTSPKTTLELAAELNISNQSISLIRRRKRWAHAD